MAVDHKILDRDGKVIEVTLTSKQAIKAMCAECSSFQKAEVDNCTAVHCPLYVFRGYWVPGKKRNFTEEQKAEFAERMRKVKESK